MEVRSNPYKMSEVNNSISQWIFPNAWKTACVTPLYKEGPANDPSNYILADIGSSMPGEDPKINTYSIIWLCHQNEYFTRRPIRVQEGTLHWHICYRIFWQYFYLTIGKNVPGGVLFLDLWKAFDTVDNEIIVSKLKSIGLNHWFKSYLMEWSQVTKVNGE